MAKLQYEDYLRRLSQRFAAALAEIETQHNFELGGEFEIAICKTLRTALPRDFDICRGYVVNAAGEQAGDDIIIYDRGRFPTLRAIGDERYAQKEWVPIEAVYAYIEAKHSIDCETIDVDDKGKAKDGTLLRACQQVMAAKQLCAARTPVPLSRIAPYVNLPKVFSVAPPHGFPSYRNPIFGAVIARHVRDKDKNVVDDPAKIQSMLTAFGGHKVAQDSLFVDLVVAGTSNVTLPVHREDGVFKLSSPFILPEAAHIYHAVVPEISFGVALANLMHALDWIELGEINWHSLLCEAVNGNSKKSEIEAVVRVDLTLEQAMELVRARSQRK